MVGFNGLMAILGSATATFCAGSAVIYFDDSHRQDVHEIYGHTSYCTKHLQWSARPAVVGLLAAAAYC